MRANLTGQPATTLTGCERADQLGAVARQARPSNGSILLCCSGCGQCAALLCPARPADVGRLQLQLQLQPPERGACKALALRQRDHATREGGREEPGQARLASERAAPFSVNQTRLLGPLSG